MARSRGRCKRLKKTLLTAQFEGKTIERELQDFLVAYRKSPQAETQASPAMLFLGKDIRSRIDLTQERAEKKTLEKSIEGKKFRIGDNAFFKILTCEYINSDYFCNK